MEKLTDALERWLNGWLETASNGTLLPPLRSMRSSGIPDPHRIALCITDGFGSPRYLIARSTSLQLKGGGMDASIVMHFSAMDDLECLVRHFGDHGTLATDALELKQLVSE